MRLSVQEDYMRSLFLLPLMAVPALAYAQPAPAPAPVLLESKIQAVVETTDAKGAKKRVLVEPKKVLPGQPLVVWLTYKNNTKKPATNFTINNPIPANVDFTGFGASSEWGVVSIDGGKTFGKLATMKVTKADKTVRGAIPQDVTHVRWSFDKPIAPGAGGTVSFYGMVE
jgi:hypothetical protein